MKYLKRLLGLPFFLCLNIIAMLWHLFILAYYFMKYGGEAISYAKKDEPKMIADIYSELVNRKNDGI